MKLTFQIVSILGILLSLFQILYFGYNHYYLINIMLFLALFLTTKIGRKECDTYIED